MPRTSSPTKERILTAAEQLFADTGVAATSLRNITGAASVNLAAVNYHFGSKEALIEAVYERRLGPLNRKRLANIERLEDEARGKPLSVEGIVHAFVDPLAEMAEASDDDGAVFSRLLAQSYTDGAGFFEKLFSEEYEIVLKRYRAAIHRSLPHLGPEETCWRLHFMIGALNHTLAGTEYLRMTDDNKEKWQVSTAIRQLEPFLCAGLAADRPAGSGREAAG